MVLELQNGLPIEVMKPFAEPTGSMTRAEFRDHVKGTAKRVLLLDRPFVVPGDVTGEDFLAYIEWLELMRRVLTGRVAQRLVRAIQQDAPDLVDVFTDARDRSVAAVDNHIEQAEQELDGLEVDAALAEGGDPVPWDDVRAELGLD